MENSKKKKWEKTFVVGTCPTNDCKHYEIYYENAMGMKLRPGKNEHENLPHPSYTLVSIPSPDSGGAFVTGGKSCIQQPEGRLAGKRRVSRLCLCCGRIVSPETHSPDKQLARDPGNGKRQESSESQWRSCRSYKEIFGKRVVQRREAATNSG